MRGQSISASHTSGSIFMWLAYTLFLFIEPAFRHDTTVWLRTVAVFAAFLGVFFVYVKTPNESVRRSMIALTFALALVSFPWNAGASTLFVYVAGFLPFTIVSVPTVLTFFGLEVAALVAEKYAFHLQWGNAIFAIFLVLVIGGGNIFFAQQRRADDKLHRAQEENIALAALAERERIARDLHDVLGHTLSVIVLKAELAGRLLQRSSPESASRAAAEIAEVERTARTALAEVREAIGGYRARGLLAEIEAARKTLDAAGVTLRCDALPETAATLRAAEETVLALALREAVTNIVRHARATACTLRFEADGGQHQLIIQDNGECPEVREGNGLRGMRERVESLGGRLLLDCTEGTRLQIALPTQAGSHAG